MEDFKVSVKDFDQNTTHTFTVKADSKNEANEKAIKFLNDNIGKNQYEIKKCHLLYEKWKYKS